MTIFGLLLGIVGTDLETGAPRFTFGIPDLYDGIELVALALGLFGIAEFLKSVNQYADVNTKYTNVRFRDMRPSARRTAALDSGHVPRHADRQPVRADSRHRPDHRVLRRLRRREKDLEDAGAVRHRHDRRRRQPGGLDAFLGAGRFHPDHEPRHSRATR